MIQPTKIFKTPKGQFGIRWNDGTVNVYNLKKLRCACPCALCVDENSGKKLLDPNTISDHIALLRVNSIGRYAIGFSWDDGHRSGIYPYTLLKDLTDLD